MTLTEKGTPQTGQPRTGRLQTGRPGAATAHASRLALGRYGETVAARYLQERGMVLLDRNWRCDAGELDLVLREGAVLVVCEVKTRSSPDYGEPLAAVTEDKLHRLRRLAARWLAEHDLVPRDVRIDLVGVIRPRRGVSVVEHIPGVGG